MAISIVEVLHTSATNASMSLATGAGTQVGDWLLALHGAAWYEYSDLVAPTGTAGTWTAAPVTTPASGGSLTLHIKGWARQVTAAGAQTVNLNQVSNTFVFGWVLVLRGAAGFDVADGVYASVEGTHTAPSVTTTAANDLLICAALTRNSGLHSAPSGMTLQGTELQGTSGGSAANMATATLALGSAGATGTKAFVQASPTWSDYAAISVAILAAAETITVAPPVIGSTAALYAPTAAATGAAPVSTPLITSTGALYAPAVAATGAAAVSPPLIDSTALLHLPSVAATGAASVSPPLIAASGSLYAPTVASTGAVTLLPSFIDSTAATYPPAVVNTPDRSDTLVYPLAEELLSCLCVALEAYPNPPARCCLRPGAEVRQDMSLFEDECCDGLAYVRIGAETASSTAFGEEDIGAVNCGPAGLMVVLEMGVFRCAPTTGLDSLVPCTDWTAAALQQANDSAAMRQALCCFGEYLQRVRPGAPVQWNAAEPIGPEGGCLGLVRSVSVGVEWTACAC